MLNESSSSNFTALKKILYIFLLVAISSLAFAGNSDKEKAGTKLVAGRVTDSFGESIPGAKIFIAETGETFFADMDGNFKLSVKTDKEYSITVNTIGFEPLVVKTSHLTSFSGLTLKSL